jgi:1,4-dihydroxy-2-naphthoate octaprenyltransferase
MKTENIRKFVSNKQLFNLIVSALMYVLGGGIAHYLGADFRPIEFWVGLIWIICIHITGYLLIIYFHPPAYLLDDEEVKDWLRQKKALILQLSLFFLTTCGVVVILLLLANKLSMNIGIVFLLTIAGLVGVAIPPFNLALKGYQEITLAIYQGCLIPATGFFLSMNIYHRLLLLITFPMTCLALASYLAANFSTYARDQRTERKSFIRLLTWQKAVPVHHILLSCAYIFFLLGYGRGLPIELLWPALLTLPMAGLQIYWLHRISRGGTPVWPFFNALSASVYGLSAYLMAFTFWTR